MKKLFGAILVGTSALALASCGDDNGVTTVQIGVDNEIMGAAIEDAWKETGNSEINLEFVKKDSAGLADSMATAQEAEVDIALVIDGEVIGNEQHFVDLSMAGLSDEGMHARYEELVHPTFGTVYYPAFYDGMAFAYNADYMEAILGANYEVDPVTNLPKEFDTWEKIFTYSKGLEINESSDYNYNMETLTGNPITVSNYDGNNSTMYVKEIYSMPINEMWSGYAMFTTGGWQLFGSENALEPGFDTPEFKDSLNFIEQAHSSNISVGTGGTTLSAADMGWRWEGLFDGDYLFGQVGTWMDVTDTDYNIEIATFPTYGDNQPTPLIKTKGFVVNTYSPENEKEAAIEVMEWLYTPETMQVLIDNSSYVPAFESGSEYDELELDEKREEFVKAFESSYMEPLYKLPDNPLVPAMDVYYNEAFKEAIKTYWDALIIEGNNEEAKNTCITTITDATEAWYEVNNV